MIIFQIKEREHTIQHEMIREFKEQRSHHIIWTDHPEQWNHSSSTVFYDVNEMHHVAEIIKRKNRLTNNQTNLLFIFDHIPSNVWKFYHNSLEKLMCNSQLLHIDIFVTISQSDYNQCISLIMAAHINKLL